MLLCEDNKYSAEKTNFKIYLPARIVKYSVTCKREKTLAFSVI
jgi:hypothetical protein